MSVAVFPGSFDPITFGHIDVVKRARSMFDRVIVAVAKNSRKRYTFSDEERLSFVQKAVENIEGVDAELVDGLIADFAQERGAHALVKGLRGAEDYAQEQAMALLNRHLSGIDTVFLVSDPTLAHIASSYVKEIAHYGGVFDDCVPADVAAALHQKVRDGRV